MPLPPPAAPLHPGSPAAPRRPAAANAACDLILTAIFTCCGNPKASIESAWALSGRVIRRQNCPEPASAGRTQAGCCWGRPKLMRRAYRANARIDVGLGEPGANMQEARPRRRISNQHPSDSPYFRSRRSSSADVTASRAAHIEQLKPNCVARACQLSMWSIRGSSPQWRSPRPTAPAWPDTGASSD